MRGKVDKYPYKCIPLDLSDNDTASFQTRRRGPMSRFFDSDTLGGMGMCNDEDTLAETGLTVSNILDH